MAGREIAMRIMEMKLEELKIELDIMRADVAYMAPATAVLAAFLVMAAQNAGLVPQGGSGFLAGVAVLLAIAVIFYAALLHGRKKELHARREKIRGKLGKMMGKA